MLLILVILLIVLEIISKSTKNRLRAKNNVQPNATPQELYRNTERTHQDPRRTCCWVASQLQWSRSVMSDTVGRESATPSCNTSLQPLVATPIVARLCYCHVWHVWQVHAVCHVVSIFFSTGLKRSNTHLVKYNSMSRAVSTY